MRPVPENRAANAAELKAEESWGTMKEKTIPGVEKEGTGEGVGVGEVGGGGEAITRGGGNVICLVLASAKDGTLCSFSIRLLSKGRQNL